MNKFRPIFIEKLGELYAEGKKLWGIHQIPFDFPPQDKWINKVLKDVKNDPDRFNKIIQQGNFLVPQPSGGFNISNISTRKKFVIDQYNNALDLPGELPVIMVITEPFGPKFLGETKHIYQYHVDSINNTKRVGLYYNTAFEKNFSIQLPFTFRSQKLVNGKGIESYNATVFSVTPNIDPSNPIIVVNWHGDSKGEKTNIVQLTEIIAWAKQNGVSYITGDSNITRDKTKVLLTDLNIPLSEFVEKIKKEEREKKLKEEEKKGGMMSFFSSFLNPRSAAIPRSNNSPVAAAIPRSNKVPITNYATLGNLLQKIIVPDSIVSYSNYEIEKWRSIMNIFSNNQIDKGGLLKDIDGMFIIDLNYKGNFKKNTHGGANYQPNKMIAFETKYTKKTPILGDHEVCYMNTSPFGLYCGTGTSMDDESIGIFNSLEFWNDIDVDVFNQKNGAPYTCQWVSTFNTWAEEINTTIIKGSMKNIPLFDIETKFPGYTCPNPMSGGRKKSRKRKRRMYKRRSKIIYKK